MKLAGVGSIASLPEPRLPTSLSSRLTFPPQPLLEFRFGSHHRIASPLSAPLPVPYHVRTKSLSPYPASSNTLARLYQKTPGVRTLKFSNAVDWRLSAHLPFDA